jgi:integrase
MSHPTKVRIIFKKKHKEDNIGFIRISFRQDGKTKLLRIPNLPSIPQNHWDVKYDRIKSSHKDYKELNQTIEKSKLDFLNSKEQNVDEKYKINFVEYSKIIIDNQYVKISTKNRFKSSLFYFQKFLKETLKKSDIPISELSPNIFQNFYNYSIQSELNPNSVSQYISTIKMLLLKIEKNEDLDFPSGLLRKIPTPKKISRKIKVIAVDDFKKILSSKFDNSKLEEARLVFLFLSFTSMRFSDVSTLKMSNLFTINSNGKYEIRINKLQKKTGGRINNLINYQGMMVIAKFLNKDLLEKDHREKVENYLNILNLHNFGNSIDKINEETKISLNVNLENQILNRHYSQNPILISSNEVEKYKNHYTTNKKLELQKKYVDDVSIDVAITEDENLIYLENLIKYIKKEILKEHNVKLNQLQHMQFDFYKLLTSILQDFRNKYPNAFVFPLLNDNDFLDIAEDNGFSNPSVEQFKKMKKSTDDFNKKLSRIAKLLEIPKFTSHSGRHTYASLLMALKGSDNVNMVDLMKNMGHSQIKQTIEYVNELNTDGADELTKLLSDRLSGG